jgi:hypothetical protein
MHEAIVAALLGKIPFAGQTPVYLETPSWSDKTELVKNKT